jgi:hypothetical protein
MHERICIVMINAAATTQTESHHVHLGSYAARARQISQTSGEIPLGIDLCTKTKRRGFVRTRSYEWMAYSCHGREIKRERRRAARQRQPGKRYIEKKSQLQRETVISFHTQQLVERDSSLHPPR